MPRKGREESPTGIYHWIVRGMNRKKIFHSERDYEFFESLLIKSKEKYKVKIYRYCHMTNHVHLLLYASDLDVLAGFSQDAYK